MTGIYLIRNKTNGFEYIGQSTDIERRITEHKTPKARGNDRLHADIQELGVSSFEFIVLEECGIEELLEREDFHIKARNPYYNWVGKKRTSREKKKISEGNKAWWKKLPTETKNKIIHENLTGPKKGHPVSKATRDAISAGVSRVQMQRVRIIETGEEFSSIGELETRLAASTGTCAAYWKGKIKSVKGFHVEKCRD